MSRYGWILILAVPAVLHTRARAADETETMLLRARDGLKPSRRDRDVARELLDEWRESERVAPGTGDPTLGRTLEALAAGRRLAPGEATVAGRMAVTYRTGRAEAAAKAGGPSGADARASGAPIGRRGLRGAAFPVVVATGVAVLAAGGVWLVLRQRSGRR
jgi:hypothetical protein